MVSTVVGIMLWILVALFIALVLKDIVMILLSALMGVAKLVEVIFASLLSAVQAGYQACRKIGRKHHV